jgi:hypothetical protein
MIYLKINDEIRNLLNLIIDTFKLGCKDYCKYQFIALDEFELLRKELEFKNLKTLTDEEYKNIIKSTESVYMHNTHMCQAPIKNFKNENNPNLNDNITADTNTNNDSDLNEEEILRELQKDKIPLKERKKEYFKTKSPDYYETEKEDLNLTHKSEIQKIRTENTLSYALSMVGSLFLLALGSYYMGKYLLGLSDSATYKLVLVVTIIVMLSEMILIVIKNLNMNKIENFYKKLKIKFFLKFFIFFKISLFYIKIFYFFYFFIFLRILILII